MKRSRIELLREARAAYRNGEPLGFGTDRIDAARYLFSGGYAVGVSAWNDDGTGYGEIREVTSRGDDAVDEWDSRWTRRFADHGARVFYAFLAAFFLFLFCHRHGECASSKRSLNLHFLTSLSYRYSAKSGSSL
jgi:hypothetical protein